MKSFVPVTSLTLIGDVNIFNQIKKYEKEFKIKIVKKQLKQGQLLSID